MSIIKMAALWRGGTNGKLTGGSGPHYFSCISMAAGKIQYPSRLFLMHGPTLSMVSREAARIECIFNQQEAVFACLVAN
ncbi:hypothetical protein [Methanomethylovorans sp.]|uniref:hypothetical protein n=1 Tax=Methanomethylovorans sp. TaxID=2758717 RepID=UPI00351C234B